MSKTFKLASHSLLAITIGLFLQQVKFVFYMVEAKAHIPNDQRRSNNPQQYGGNQYGQGVNQRGLQPQYSANPPGRAPLSSMGASSPWQERETNFDELCPEWNRTSVYYKWIPSALEAKYDHIGVLNKNQGQMYVKLCCPGYEPIRDRRWTYCGPVCENCRNGRCVGPNECECYDGFVRNDNGDCVFSCPLGCLNGRCYLDGSCQCDPGYKLDESRRFCRPICSKGCGTDPSHNCTAPEMCGCKKGFTLTNRGCQAVCTPDCGIGGECNRDGKCVCSSGYVLADRVCQAECYQTCKNGMCHNKNRCICNPGYVYDQPSTNCVPPVVEN